MKKIILVTFTVTTFIGVSFGQSKNNSLFSNASTTNKSVLEPIADSDLPRYRIVQSPLAARETFKIDTYLGNVYQLTVDTNGRNKWQPMLRLQAVDNDIQYGNKPNYSLFVSTLSVKYTFVININSGATWQLFEDTKTKTNFFAPIE